MILTTLKIVYLDKLLESSKPFQFSAQKKEIKCSTNSTQSANIAHDLWSAVLLFVWVFSSAILDGIIEMQK